ncbi:aldehyde ferredoxin oxidoreductase family protein [Chloroflexota bacterium]
MKGLKIMTGGYVGRILYVDLSHERVYEEGLEEKLCYDFLGGYGLGARILFSRQEAGINPIGPENHLGFLTGPLTGTSFFCPRYTVVGKSPLTNTWGDANSGGDFGPKLKFAGYDAVFFYGVSDKPVFLSIDNGKLEIRDAAHLWGKDTYLTQELLKAECGKDASVACIGPAGEKLSLISCIVNDGGRAAARSGLGAVMGSKKLKAVVVRGNRKILVSSEEMVKKLRIKWLNKLRNNPIVDRWKKFGTSANLAANVAIGDAPVKNWRGIASIDYPEDLAKSATFDNAKNERYIESRYSCWGCPVACGAHIKEGLGSYKYPAGTRRPEYETMASFGSMCLNGDLDSIIKANDICNRYGLDTISVGATIAFAIECYENGLISKKDTDGIELNWGGHQSIVAMTEKLACREGFGQVIADGVKLAALRIGKGADQYAMHIQGQEVGMHDPRLRPGWATSYKIDATPGRHTQGGAHLMERYGDTHGLDVRPVEPYVYSGKGSVQKKMSSYNHVLNALGFCMFNSVFAVDFNFFVQSLNSVTGWNYTDSDLLRAGDRIANIRMAFNIREGINPLKFHVPGRIIGNPPLSDGSTAGVTIDLDLQVKEFLEEMGWDVNNGKPSNEILRELGLNDVAEAIFT